LDEAQKQQKVLADELGKQGRQVIALEQERDQLKTQVAAAEAAKNAAAQQADETARLKSAVAEAEQRAKQAESAFGQRGKDIIALQTDLQNARRSLKELTDAQASTAQAVKAADEARHERDNLRQQLESSNTLLAELRVDRDGLQAQLKKVAGEKDALDRQLADRGDAATRLAAATSQLEDAHKELLTLKTGNTELTESVRRLTDERDQAHTQAAAAESAKAESATLQDRVAALTSQLETSRRDLGSAQNTRVALRLEEAQATIASLQRENADLQSERSSLASRLAQAAAATTTAAVSTAATAATGSTDDAVRLKAELARAEEKVEMTVRSFALVQQENEKLKTQIAQADGERTTAIAQAQESGRRAAEADVTRLNAELADTRDIATRAATETTSLREQLRQTQNTNASLTVDNARLRTALAQPGGTMPTGAGISPTRPAAPAALTVAPVTAPAVSAAPPPAPAPRTHRVVAGDTLTRLSRRYYGTWTRWQEIYDANRDKLRNPDILPLDVELKIP
jgi:chromosome segregation ATPase